MGSDESTFNVLLIVRDKVTKQCPQTTTFKEKGEPKRIRTEVLLLTSLTARPNLLSAESNRNQSAYTGLTARPSSFMMHYVHRNHKDY